MHLSQKSMSSINLELTKENCPALEHAFIFSDIALVEGSETVYSVKDRIGDVEISIGVNPVINDDYSISQSAGALDAPLRAGNWVQPGTKTALFVNMCGDGASPAIGVIGASGVAPVSDGIRCNTALANVMDYNAGVPVTVQATAPASTESGAIRAVRATPGDTINSIEVDSTGITINTPASLTTIPTLDELGDVTSWTAAAPYWAWLVFHFTTAPSDNVIGMGLAFIREQYPLGNFILPPMWKDYV